MMLENQKLDRYNLLVIDDEVEITKSLARQFRHKYNIFTSTSADNAFPILEKEKIHVVISDQRMPGLTGVDFFSIIKNKYPDPVKIILTGFSDIDAVIGAINDGQIFRYITKPWDPIELDMVVREAIEKQDLVSKNKQLMESLQVANATLEEKVKKRTEELQLANSKLINLNEEKNQYIGIVAHDLRNPIGAAHSFSSLLMDDFDNIGRNEKLNYIGIINQRCDFALNLMVDILDVSKIEAGIFHLNLKEENYIEFVKGIIAQNEILAKNKSQHFEFRPSKESIFLPFDKDKMEQVFNNLLSNSIKYSYPGSTTYIEIAIENKSVKTKIIDQGQGISQEEIQNVFQAYQTTSTKSTGNEKSTGLGLAIVKKIVETHGGTITAESEIGKGSVFTFKLPINKEEDFQN